jgi:uncharacterized membrane protein YgdD (TMEM256/DUF423 family)
MRIWLTLAAVMGALSVLCGAFAAHGLAGRLPPQALSVFDTGARYQMYHALAMGLCVFAMRGEAQRPARISAILFLVGILLFSGSLYLLALTGITALGFVTPLGGLCFLGGWGALAWAASRLP